MRSGSRSPVPGRVPRPDPRGLHPGPAPVHRLVPSPVPAAVLGPPRGHRDLRPRTRSPRPGPGNRHPPPVHDRGVYRYAVEEELLDHSPSAHFRRPRLDYESHASALDRSEIGALLVAAGLGPAAEHALISLLALNGFGYRRPPVPASSTWAWSEATAPWSLLARSSPSRSPRAPPAPSTWRPASAPTGRCSSLRTGGGWTGTVPPALSAGSRAAPASASTSARTPCGTRSSPPRSTPGPASRRARGPPLMPTRAPRCVTTGRGHRQRSRTAWAPPTAKRRRFPDARNRVLCSMSEPLPACG